jgi:hypothetical protein
MNMSDPRSEIEALQSKLSAKASGQMVRADDVVDWLDAILAEHPIDPLRDATAYNEAFRVALEVYLSNKPKADTEVLQAFSAGWIARRNAIPALSRESAPCTCDEGDPSCPHEPPARPEVAKQSDETLKYDAPFRIVPKRHRCAVNSNLHDMTANCFGITEVEK